MRCLINRAQGTSLKRVAGAASQPEFTLWRVPRAWADLPPLDNANTILWLLLLLLTKAFPWLLATSTLNRKASCSKADGDTDPMHVISGSCLLHCRWLSVRTIRLCSFPPFYRGADKSLTRPTSRCIFFHGESASFDASFVIYINSTNIPPIMIKIGYIKLKIFCR